MNLFKYVGIVPLKAADGPVADVYGQVRREIGRFVEAVAMFSADPVLLTATWAAFREPLLATGQAPRMFKETVAATVSRLNECPYCVDAHSVMLYGGGAGTVATQLLGGVSADQVDGEYRDLCRWAQDTARADTAPAAAPFAAAWAPEVVGVLVYFHFLNRMINILLTGTFLPGPEGARKIARRVGGRVMSGKITAELGAGLAPGLHRAGPLPADLGWAAPSAPIADAFTMMASVTDSAARRAAAPEALDLVERTVAAWRGEAPGISAGWVNEPLSALSEADRPAARLGLLAALAPYQITERDVDAYRAVHPGDADLLGLLSWSAFLAARRVGTWAAQGIAAPAGTDAPAGP